MVPVSAFGERHSGLDLARGVAVLGILGMNITDFAFGQGYVLFGPDWIYGDETDHFLNALGIAFVHGKARGLLALVFGIGLYLQFRSRIAVPGAWPGGYMKRLAWLGAIGLAHAVFLWSGDILMIYAVTAFIAMWFVSSQSTLIWSWVWACLFLSFGLGVLTTLVIVLLGLDSTSVFLGTLAGEGDIATATFAASYGEDLVFRLTMLPVVIGSQILYLPVILIPFLIGLILARDHAILDPKLNGPTLRWALKLGLGLGIPLNLWVLLLWRWNGAHATLGIIQAFCGFVLALGVFAVLLLWAQSGRLALIRAALGNVGRVALSCYILQSVLCMFAFAPWALGLDVCLLGATAVMGSVWVANLLFAAIWLRFYQLGPMEWLWRSLTEGRVLPMRRSPEPTSRPA